jgi:hypothetical protein
MPRAVLDLRAIPAARRRLVGRPRRSEAPVAWGHPTSLIGSRVFGRVVRPRRGVPGRGVAESLPRGSGCVVPTGVRRTGTEHGTMVGRGPVRSGISAGCR